MAGGQDRRRSWDAAVGGVDLHIDGPAEGPWSDAIEGFVACADPPTEDPDPGRIELAVPVGLPLAAPDAADEELGFSSWTTPQGPVVAMGPGRLAFPEPHTAAIDADPPGEAEAVRRGLPYLLGWLLASRDVWLVHGAAVIPPGLDGAGLLLVGATGAGKSTCAASALEAGWPVVADDMVAVRFVRGHAEMLGVRFPINVPADLAGLSFSGPFVDLETRPRRMVGVPGDVPLVRGWCPIGGVATIEHGSADETRVGPRLSAEAARALWTSSFASLFAIHFRTWFSRAAELSRSPCFGLALGSNPDRRLESTIRALSDIAPSHHRS